MYFVKILWSSLQNHLKNDLPLQNLTLQSAVFGFLDEPDETRDIANHILLIFKIFLFKNRTFKPTSKLLFARIKNAANIESQLCLTNKQRTRYNQKWQKVFNQF